MRRRGDDGDPKRGAGTRRRPGAEPQVVEHRPASAVGVQPRRAEQGDVGRRRDELEVAGGGVDAKLRVEDRDGDRRHAVHGGAVPAVAVVDVDRRARDGVQRAEVERAQRARREHGGLSVDGEVRRADDVAAEALGDAAEGRADGRAERRQEHTEGGREGVDGGGGDDGDAGQRGGASGRQVTRRRGKAGAGDDDGAGGRGAGCGHSGDGEAAFAVDDGDGEGEACAHGQRLRERH